MIGLLVFVPALIVTALVTTLMIESKAKKPDDRRPKSFDELSAMQREQSAYDSMFEVILMIVTAVVTAVFLVWSVINGDWN